MAGSEDAVPISLDRLTECFSDRRGFRLPNVAYVDEAFLLRARSGESAEPGRVSPSRTPFRNRPYAQPVEFMGPRCSSLATGAACCACP